MSAQTVIAVSLTIGTLSAVFMNIYITSVATYSVPRAPTISYIVEFCVVNIIGPTLTVGVPVALFLQFGLVSPLVVLVLEFAVWTLATVTSPNGEAPPYYFAFILVYIYLPLSALFGGIEYYFRVHGHFLSLSLT